MQLVSLQIQNIRNIKDAYLEPDSELNFIFGENGSGKTSLLESIYLLARGKSFRTRHLAQILKKDTESLLIMGKLSQCSGTDGREKRVGIEYQPSMSTRIRIDGQNAQRSSELTRILPLSIINGDSSRLLSATPKLRRNFLDWGVFHVEHSFLGVWQRYGRTLKQRNAALRLGATLKEIQGWDHELSSTAQKLHQARELYIQTLERSFQRYIQKLCDIDSTSLELRYDRGWSSDIDLLIQLSESIQSDRAAGFTHKGPHRADINTWIKARPASQFASNGQQKLMVCALYLAQLEIYSQFTKKQCVILVDDLPSELDITHRKTFLSLLCELNAQVFLTATELELVDFTRQHSGAMFHVEHGCVSKTS